MSKTRRLELDIIRIMACIMVITMHAPIPNHQDNGLFLSSISYLTAPCIGLFFMVSGSLLLPIKTDGIVFLKKRFTKVLLPTLFWTIFYILSEYLISGKFGGIETILSIPFSPQGNGILWFMYTLAGLYLLAPIISRWLEKATQKEIEIYLTLWVISTCYPLLELFLTTTKGATNILYYFSGYAGYFLLGYYLNKYPTSFSYKWLIPSCMVALIAPIYCKLYQIEVDFYQMFWYLSIFIVIMATTWFKIIHDHFNNKIFHFSIDKLANLSFGIYLSHIFIMRQILWKWELILQIENYILSTFTVIVLTFIGSTLLSYLIALLPWGDSIIGYKFKKTT